MLKWCSCGHAAAEQYFHFQMKTEISIAFLKIYVSASEQQAEKRSSKPHTGSMLRSV